MGTFRIMFDLFSILKYVYMITHVSGDVLFIHILYIFCTYTYI
jgi:hypothetical protein